MLKAVKFTENQFKEMICDEDITLRGVTDYHPQVEEDLGEVDFSEENMTMDPNMSFTKKDYVKYLGYNELDNGMTFVGYMAGGDWELPLFFIVYYDGDSLRGYIPVYGNSYNYVLKTAFGSEGDSLVRLIDEQGFEHLQKMYEGLEDEEDVSEALGDSFFQIEVSEEFSTPDFEKMMKDIKSNIGVV